MAGISPSYNFSRINSVTNIKINILNKHDKNHVLYNCLILNLLKTFKIMTTKERLEMVIVRLEKEQIKINYYDYYFCSNRFV